jgi:type II secretory pathway pseudopilin PulG
MDPTQRPVPGPEAQTDSKAIWSLVCGILSITCFWILTGIPAIILGHLSRSSIRNSMGRLKGEGMALAGLILGYISVLLIPVLLILAAIAIPGFLRARQTANEAAAVQNLRTITQAETGYREQRGPDYADVETLVSNGLLDESFRSTIAGYNFTIVADGTAYTATATPATSATGRYGYYVTTDSVVRYSTNEALAPTAQSGLPVP